MAEQEKKLSVAQMREILKAKGVKNTSIMRKAELQERMAALGLQENGTEVQDRVQSAVSEDTTENNEVRNENRRPYVFKGRAPRAVRTERTVRTERPERTERQDKERAERPERMERPERTER